MLESEMLSKGLSFLENNKQYKIVKQEVPFLSRYADIHLPDKKILPSDHAVYTHAVFHISSS